MLTLTEANLGTESSNLTDLNSGKRQWLDRLASTPHTALIVWKGSHPITFTKILIHINKKMPCNDAITEKSPYIFFRKS